MYHFTHIGGEGWSHSHSQTPSQDFFGGSGGSKSLTNLSDNFDELAV